MQDPDGTHDSADIAEVLRRMSAEVSEATNELPPSVLKTEEETNTESIAPSHIGLPPRSANMADSDTPMADPLDQFEVDPAQKQFLLEVLESGVAPPEEVKLLKEVSTPIVRPTQFKEIDSDTKELVERFATTQLLKLRAQGGVGLMKQYAMDIYHYARAVGPQFGQIWARQKVLNNEAVFRQYLWSRGHNISKAGVYTEFSKADTKETAALVGTLILDDGFFWAEIEKLQKRYGGLNPGQKRKRGDSSAPMTPVTIEGKSAQNLEKRRKGNNQTSITSGVQKQDIFKTAEFKKTRKEQKKARRVEGAARGAGKSVPATTQQASGNTPAQKKKQKAKAKTGPESSTYFVPANEEATSKVATKMASPSASAPEKFSVLSSAVKQDLPTAEQSSTKVAISGAGANGGESKRARKRKKAAEFRLLEHAAKQTPQDHSSVQNDAGNTQEHTVPMNVVVQAPESITSASGESKRNRKRKKNNNRLPDEPPKLKAASTYYSDVKPASTVVPKQESTSAKKPPTAIEVLATEAVAKPVGSTKPKRQRTRKGEPNRAVKIPEDIQVIKEEAEHPIKATEGRASDEEAAPFVEETREKKPRMELVAETLAREKATDSGEFTHGQTKSAVIKEKQQKKSPMELIAAELALEKAQKALPPNAKVEADEEPFPVTEDTQKAFDVLMADTDIDSKGPQASDVFSSDPVAEISQSAIEGTVREQEPTSSQVLSELPDVNIKKGKGRKSRKRKSEEVKDKVEDGRDQDSASGGHLLDKSCTQEKSKDIKGLPEAANVSQDHDSFEAITAHGLPIKDPGRFVVCTPPKPKVPVDFHDDLPLPQTQVDTNSQLSIKDSTLSMERHGSMERIERDKELGKIDIKSEEAGMISSSSVAPHAVEATLLGTPKKKDVPATLTGPSFEDLTSFDLCVQAKELRRVTKLKKVKAPAKSPYFAPSTPTKKSTPKSLKQPSDQGEDIKRTPSLSKASPKKSPRPPAGTVSCIPFPPLSAPYFGLIQEKLASDPFRLLIAVTFLIRTHGKHAIPVFFELMEKYPTPESLIAADKEDIVPIIRHLGLQNQRAATYQTYARIWLEDPPVKDKRYAVRDYPTKGAGRDIKKGEILTDSDLRQAWEIGHMTQGPYALDSWRIFCRDVCRGVAISWNCEGNNEQGLQPEWMRVLPEDKELRAYLRWMWLKEGFEWDPFTGEKEVASERLMKAGIEGRIAWDDKGGMRIIEPGELEPEAGAALYGGLNVKVEDGDQDVTKVKKEDKKAVKRELREEVGV